MKHEQPIAARGKNWPPRNQRPARASASANGKLSRTDFDLTQDELTLEHEELLETQAQLESSRELYANLYDSAPIGYLTLSRAGCIGKINLAGAQLLRRPRERLKGQPLLVFVAKPDRRKYLRHLSLCRQRSGDRLSTELWLQPDASGGSTCVELISSVPVDCRSDSPIYNSAMIDVTRRREAECSLRAAHEELELRVQERTAELTRANAALLAEIAGRKQIERNLRESEERFRLLIENSRDYAIFMLNPQGRVMTWNESAERIKGYRAGEILGRHCSYFYTHADVRSGKPRRLLETARLTGRAEDEGWRVRKDRSRFWASEITTALRDETGGLRGFTKVTRDITERRQAQEVLQVSERNLSDFFDQSPLGLLWVGPKGKIHRVNQVGLELFGCTLESCLDHPMQKFYADPKQAGHDLRRLAREEILQNQRARLRRPDGTIRHVLIDASGQWEEDRMIHSRWFVRDITRRVELEREILVIAERERRRIGQDLHDDLCQQLTGIEFLSQTLARQLSTPPRSNADRAREIARLVRRAITHTRELAHGLSPVELETRGLTGALQELAGRTRKLFKVDCRFRGQRSDLKHDPTLDIHLYRIAQEAVANALKHGQSKRVDIELTQKKHRLVLAVRDDGIGLSEKPHKGKGMGLQVMQYRAGVISGSLEFRRNPTGGTAVVCTVNDGFTNPQPTTNL